MDEPQTGRHRLPDAGQWMRLIQRHQSEHPSLVRVLDVFDRLQDRPYRSNALLQGEPGTGKEGLARALHALMQDQPGPFVECSLTGRAVGAAAADLCGEPGAPGLIERADGGTLYLDEVAGIPAELQLRVLSAVRGRVRREGELDERPVRVTVIAATEGDLRAEVRAGRFRHDLYYRLARIELALPPLRERREDVGRLALWIGTRILHRAGLERRLLGPDERADEDSAGALTLTEDAIEALAAHDWPGNLRELDAVLERALMLYAPPDGPVTAGHVRAALAGPTDPIDALAR
jgi:DNA-binding NtrC family response regulator